MKKKDFDQELKRFNKEWLFTLRFSLYCLVFGVLLGFLLCSIFNADKCQGIGGFVYQEIEWQDQTINVIQENCRNGLYIDDWTYNDKMELYCYTEDCFGDYCKNSEWRSGVYTKK